jgi:hypothetical protein
MAECMDLSIATTATGADSPSDPTGRIPPPEGSLTDEIVYRDDDPRTIYERSELESYNTCRLRYIAKERVLPAGGARSQLIERILRYRCDQADDVHRVDLDGATIRQLKGVCKRYSLRRSGLLGDLKRRIIRYREGHHEADEAEIRGLQKLTCAELLALCQQRGLSIVGSREDLIKHIINPIQWAAPGMPDWVKHPVAKNIGHYTQIFVEEMKKKALKDRVNVDEVD